MYNLLFVDDFDQAPVHILISDIEMLGYSGFELLFISESYLSRTFTKDMGMTLFDYITECRINKAKELLVSTDLTVTAICTQVGYNYAAYFTKVFKEKTGITPNQYRERGEA